MEVPSRTPLLVKSVLLHNVGSPYSHSVSVMMLMLMLCVSRQLLASRYYFYMFPDMVWLCEGRRENPWIPPSPFHLPYKFNCTSIAWLFGCVDMNIHVEKCFPLVFYFRFNIKSCALNALKNNM